VRTAWELARAWPGSDLHVIGDSGHTGSAAMGARIGAALDAFARR
jgi:proline iminopeptidase